ncbi:MAG: DNA-binding protein [Vicinamibacterales bacterium]
MNTMNETARLRLRDFMTSDEGWGRIAGREVAPKLLDFIERSAGVPVFRVSLAGVRRVDISFASETLVELARRFRGRKGFCFIDLADPDMRENWEAAALRAAQPLLSWHGDAWSVVGPTPKEGLAGALEFALKREESRAADYAAETPKMSITNASTKFKQLWEQGFLLRREAGAESGGIEYLYFPIR